MSSFYLACPCIIEGFNLIEDRQNTTNDYV